MCDSLPWEGREGFLECHLMKPLPATARFIAPLPGEGIKNSVAYILSGNLQYYLRCPKSLTSDKYAYSLQTT